jgi:Plant transposon protein
MSNLFIESLERFKRHRKARGEFDDEEHLEEPYVDEIEAGYRRAFKNRKVYNRENYRDSCWYKFLQRDLMDLNERDGKTFRLRFTVPFQLYQQLLGFAERWFPQRKVDACGKEVTPISLKLLGTLRILGKGCSWDLLYELSGVSAEVHRKWTLAFIAKFSTEMYSVYVYGPRNSEELNAVTSLYAACGFPGCVGSTDCVHIRWECCPSMWSSVFRNGKHNYASIAYEMTVDHSKRFQATTIEHYGTTSDKTIVKFDGFVNSVRFDKLFTEAKFKIQVSDASWVVETGVYLLVDGGYHKWSIMQCPLKHTVEEDKARWSEFAESIRKDVECSFGIQKKRFQFLKNAITWQRKSDIDNAVFSCVILHNMLHEFDGYDKRWEAQIENTHFDKEEQMHLNRIRRRVVKAIENTEDYTEVGRLQHNINNIGYARILDDDVAVEISSGHEVLRDKLIKHLNIQYLNDKLRWLRI